MGKGYHFTFGARFGGDGVRFGGDGARLAHVWMEMELAWAVPQALCSHKLISISFACRLVQPRAQDGMKCALMCNKNFVVPGLSVFLGQHLYGALVGTPLGCTVMHHIVSVLTLGAGRRFSFSEALAVLGDVSTSEFLVCP